MKGYASLVRELVMQSLYKMHFVYSVNSMSIISTPHGQVPIIIICSNNGNSIIIANDIIAIITPILNCAV